MASGQKQDDNVDWKPCESLNAFQAEFKNTSLKNKAMFMGNDLVTFLTNHSDEINTYDDMAAFTDSIATNWLKSPNPKVILYGLEALMILADTLQENYKPYCSIVMPECIARLGDTKANLREKAKMYLIKTVEVGANSPGLMFDEMSNLFSIRNKLLVPEAQKVVAAVYQFVKTQNVAPPNEVIVKLVKAAIKGLSAIGKSESEAILMDLSESANYSIVLKHLEEIPKSQREGDLGKQIIALMKMLSDKRAEEEAKKIANLRKSSPPKKESKAKPDLSTETPKKVTAAEKVPQAPSIDPAPSKGAIPKVPKGRSRSGSPSPVASGSGRGACAISPIQPTSRPQFEENRRMSVPEAAATLLQYISTAAQGASSLLPEQQIAHDSDSSSNTQNVIKIIMKKEKKKVKSDRTVDLEAKPSLMNRIACSILSGIQEYEGKSSKTVRKDRHHEEVCSRETVDDKHRHREDSRHKERPPSERRHDDFRVRETRRDKHRHREASRHVEHRQREASRHVEHREMEASRDDKHRHREASRHVKHRQREASPHVEHREMEASRDDKHHHREARRDDRHRQRESSRQVEHRQMQASRHVEHRQMEASRDDKHRHREASRHVKHRQREASPHVEHREMEASRDDKHRHREARRDDRHRQRESSRHVEHRQMEASRDDKHRRREASRHDEHPQREARRRYEEVRWRETERSEKVHPRDTSRSVKVRPKQTRPYEESNDEIEHMRKNEMKDDDTISSSPPFPGTIKDRGIRLPWSGIKNMKPTSKVEIEEIQQEEPKMVSKGVQINTLNRSVQTQTEKSWLRHFYSHTTQSGITSEENEVNYVYNETSKSSEKNVPKKTETHATQTCDVVTKIFHLNYK